MMNTDIWHPISSLHGVGPVTATACEAFGVRFTEHLLGADPVSLARSLATIDGVTMDEVLSSFIPQAELLRLPGMSPELSKALLDHSLTLASLTTVTATTIRELLARDGVEVDETTVLRWQLEATRSHFCCARLLTVNDTHNDAPLVGASVTVVNPLKADVAVRFTTQTNDYGQVFLQFLAPGEHEVQVEFNERKRVISMFCESGTQASPVVEL